MFEYFIRQTSWRSYLSSSAVRHISVIHKGLESPDVASPHKAAHHYSCLEGARRFGPLLYNCCSAPVLTFNSMIF